jgi:hypothetical protein
LRLGGHSRVADQYVGHGKQCVMLRPLTGQITGRILRDADGPRPAMVQFSSVFDRLGTGLRDGPKCQSGQTLYGTTPLIRWPKGVLYLICQRPTCSLLSDPGL